MSATSSVPAAASAPPEKIIFETQPLILPTILSAENIVIVGFSLVIVILAVVFHLGLQELLIIGLLYFLIALPGLREIFQAGSTNYVLTNKRLVIFTVGFGPKERSIPLKQIQDVKIKYSGLQRLYRAGSILIYPKGLGRPVRLKGLPDVRKRADQIQQAMKAA